MKRKRFRRTSKDQQIGQVDDQTTDDELYDDALSKAPADYYERRRKNTIKIQELDVWVAVGLYLAFSSVAFVVL